MERGQVLKIILFGLGYSAGYFADSRGDAHQITASVTTREKALAASSERREAFVFSPEETGAGLRARIAEAEAMIVSIPPDAAGDPTLAAFGEDIARAGKLRCIVYLSTIGVYGDHQGAWVNETSDCHPVNERSQWRLNAEGAWRMLGSRTGKAVHVLRLAGIYGPGQNALVNLRKGTARRIVKPGQVFNRIHVEDIARAIEACFTHAGGVWNVADDEPAPAEDVVTFAAELLGMEPPPLTAFEDANMSPMARSFYAETKRASNAAMKRELGVKLEYPDFRVALRAMCEAGEGAP